MPACSSLPAGQGSVRAWVIGLSLGLIVPSGCARRVGVAEYVPQSSERLAVAPGSVRSRRETARSMCGRFTSSQRREAIGERFEVAVPETYQHRFNLAPAAADANRPRARRRARGGDGEVGSSAALGEGPQDRVQDDQRESGDADREASLLEPYPAELMVALPASTRVNSVRNDDSGLLLPEDALAA